MIIAVNTRFLKSDYLEGYGHYLYEMFSRITKTHPEHQFIFIFDRPYDKRFVFAENVKPVIAGPAARHPILWKYWYDIRVPAILKKYRADAFVSCDGFCSLTTKVPQCLVIHDLSFLHYPAFIPRSHWLFYKSFTPKFLRKAKRVVTVSEFSKKDIIMQYQTDEAKIDVAGNAAREMFHRMASEDKQLLKDRLTNGHEYFLYTGAIHPRKNLMALLKAFSVFKKRQLSNWKLVLAGRLAWKNKEFNKSLETYKYRTEVIMTGYVSDEELARITGSAYALVYPSLWEGFGMPVLEAMRSGVPVITSAHSAMEEIAADAALFADPTDHNDLAEKMMMLYKDENLRSRLIERGRLSANRYSWDQSADLLWKSILKVME